MPKNDKKIYREVKPARVDLTQVDMYELCYDVVNEERVFTGEIGEKLLVERYNPLSSTKRDFDLCSVEEIVEDNTLIKFWDIVRGQWYFVDMCNENLPIVLRIKQVTKQRRSKKHDVSEVFTITPEVGAMAQEFDHETGSVDADIVQTIDNTTLIDQEQQNDTQQ